MKKLIIATLAIFVATHANAQIDTTILDQAPEVELDEIAGVTDCYKDDRRLADIGSTIRTLRERGSLETPVILKGITYLKANPKLLTALGDSIAVISPNCSIQTPVDGAFFSKIEISAPELIGEVKSAAATEDGETLRRLKASFQSSAITNEQAVNFLSFLEVSHEAGKVVCSIFGVSCSTNRGVSTLGLLEVMGARVDGQSKPVPSRSDQHNIYFKTSYGEIKKGQRDLRSNHPSFYTMGVSLSEWY